ncbi:MAG: trigger factor [Deltaproteobacteria bacterium]|nr:trigger factor [Deltaproteobacteria bacterium]
MNTSVQVINEIEIRIEVEIPADKVDKELDRQLGEFGKRARLKGFRPGKAPKDMVRKTFAADIAAEATKRLINDSYQAAIEASKHRTVGEPKIEPGIARSGEVFKYAIKTQVKPVLDIHSWKDIEVTVPPVQIGADAVNAKIAELQAREMERVPVDDRGADTGDVLIVDFEGYLEGVRNPRLDGDAMELKLGQGRMIPGFEDALMGVRTGEARTVEATFPDDYGVEELNGRAARFEVTVKEHLREELPDLDDDFATDLGFESLDALREDTHAKLVAEAEDKRKDEIERKVLAVVFERNPFPVPPAMVEYWAAERVRSLVSMMRSQGVSEQRAWQFAQQNFEGMKAAAAWQVRRHLVLEALGRSEKIEIDDETLSAEIVARIKKHGESAGTLYEQPQARAALMEEMIERRALEAIIASAHVVAG